MLQNMKIGLLLFVILRPYKNKNLKTISSMVLLSLTLLLLTYTSYHDLTTYGLPGRGISAGSGGVHPTHNPNPQINTQRNGPSQNKFVQPSNDEMQANVIRPNNNEMQANVIRPTVNCPTIGHPNTPHSTAVGRTTNNCNNINGQVTINSGSSSSSSSSSLTVNNGGGRSYNNNGAAIQAPTQYAVPMLVSYSPIANAGYNQIVHSNDYVVLDGSGSYDPYGSILYYSWIQSPGQDPIALSPNSNQPKVTFVAPQVTEITTLTFELLVNNGRANSDPSYTYITIYP
ncbi:MAG: PKD domain-containing protein [Nitrososphaeraceae archaeon]